ncbi:aminotransferase class I/II-fold pyridoxal phosphate-dependent enzyme [Collinsella sp. D33t1_170424_A12]|uniref:pyridoxal phosphate-dependent decarboxylase family protein n=1 Tax=Collinsella sp. D33t1_170424_A12 TaxID=2787135 RepID=UPI00189A845E|nr:aminotransferase class I/II-fold pyridoxal phosphate-dependent enzyme [Collinsella sp. D33t1_170424_A12]
MYAKGTAQEADVELAAVRFVCELFSRNRHLSEGPVSCEASPERLRAIAERGIPAQGRPLDEVVEEMQRDIIGYGYNIDHARFMGFVPGPVNALSWLGDMMASGYNRHAGSFANYPAGCVAEHELLRWFCDKAGFPEGAGGVFVSGGSMANMTALVAARDAKLAEDEWCRGVAYVSEQTHSSVAKGLHMIGIAPSRIRVIPCHDEDFTMDLGALERAIVEDRDAGLKPFAIIATAGSTNTGAVGPLPQIADIARAYGLWMHVDGAIGASVLLTRYRDMLRGVERADSLSWDAHKWLFQTYSCGMVLVRDERTLLRSFNAHPEYLKDLEESAQITNPWDLGPELTRPARGLKLWFTLQVMGSDALSAAVEHGFDLARWAQDELERDERVQIVSPAQMAMINFRYAPAGLGEEELDRLNARISRRMVASGFAGVFTTELRGMKVLRICCIHPETTEDDMRETVRRLGALCDEGLAAMRDA